MSFYKDASLVFLPSGGAGKDGKAYSMKPTDGSGDFTFSRGSNLTATRIDSNGLIEKGRENLLLQSNSFLTTWTTSNASVTGGQAGYDGSSDAWLLTSLTAADNYINQFVSSSGVQTYSVYAKAGTAAGIWIQLRTGNYPYLKVNLTNGTFIAKHSSVISYEIKDVGNGWYRVSFAANNSNIQARIKVCDASGSALVAGNIYIQDAQLEQGLVATEYIESGATTGLAGLLEDSPRFDYSGGASCPSLLLEGSRTNLVPQSEYLNSSLISKSNDFEINTSDTTSPEGLNNACKFDFPSGSIRYFGKSVSTLNTATASVFVKAGSHQYVQYVSSTTATFAINFDVANGTSNVVGTLPSGATYNIEEYGNYWYRIWVSHDHGATAPTLYWWMANDLNTPRAQVVTSAGNMYLYGFQIEEGSYPTSYIPNHSGGSVTREADSAEVTSASSIIGQTEGTIFLEFKADNVSLDIIGINRSLTNGILIFKTASNLIRAQIYSGGSSTTLTNTGVLSGVIKLALVYKSRESSLFINGTKVATSTNNISFTASLNLVEFMGNYFAGIGKNEVQQTLLFPTALSDADCITLTS